MRLQISRSSGRLPAGLSPAAISRFASYTPPSTRSARNGSAARTASSRRPAAGRLSTASMAAATASGVRLTATLRAPVSATTVATSPTSVVTTGRPVANASRPTVGPVSKAEVMSSASLARIRRPPLRATRAQERGRRFEPHRLPRAPPRCASRPPSPATSRWSCRTSARSAATARASSSGSFCPSRRPANRRRARPAPARARRRARSRPPPPAASAPGWKMVGSAQFGRNANRRPDSANRDAIVIGGLAVDDVDARHAREGPTLCRRQRRAERAAIGSRCRSWPGRRPRGGPPATSGRSRPGTRGRSRAMEGRDQRRAQASPRCGSSARREAQPAGSGYVRSVACGRPGRAAAIALEGDLAPLPRRSRLGQAQEAQLEVVRGELHEAAHEGRDRPEPASGGVRRQDSEDGYGSGAPASGRAHFGWSTPSAARRRTPRCRRPGNQVDARWRVEHRACRRFDEAWAKTMPAARRQVRRPGRLPAITRPQHPAQGRHEADKRSGQ